MVIIVQAHMTYQTINPQKEGGDVNYRTKEHNYQNNLFLLASKFNHAIVQTLIKEN